jgi:hypothetical protein
MARISSSAGRCLESMPLIVSAFGVFDNVNVLQVFSLSSYEKYIIFVHITTMNFENNSESPNFTEI